MKALRRFTSRITSSFDWVVSQVENHEALVNATIQEVSHHAAKAQSQAKRVARDGKKLRERIRELQESALAWEERAKQTKESDTLKALECLKRKRRIELEVSELETQVIEHSKIESQLQRELQSILENLEKLKRDRNLMRTRESRAQALASLPGSEYTLVAEIEDVFERWDEKVTEYEIRGDGLVAEEDQLEEEFLSKEQEQELLLELENL